MFPFNLGTTQFLSESCGAINAAENIRMIEKQEAIFCVRYGNVERIMASIIKFAYTLTAFHMDTLKDNNASFIALQAVHRTCLNPGIP